MSRTCPPCDYACGNGADCPARGGTYYPLLCDEPSEARDLAEAPATAEGAQSMCGALLKWIAVGIAIGCAAGVAIFR